MLVSAHGVPLLTGSCLQPDFGSQRSTVHGLLSSQLIGTAGMQRPAWHASAPLQGLPSLHDVPFGASVVEQPLVGLHASTVHGFPSLQAERWMHPKAGPHASSVHVSPSLQSRDNPAAQRPFPQASFTLHRLPSL